MPGRQDGAEPRDRWPAIRARLTANAHLLAHRGALIPKAMPSGRTVWAVRFVDRTPQGEVIQRAIYVGDDPALLARVRSWIEECRRPDLWREEAAEYARLAFAASTAVRRVLSGAGVARKRFEGRRRRPAQRDCQGPKQRH